MKKALLLMMSAAKVPAAVAADLSGTLEGQRAR
jgi:hypothetical protein